MGTLRPTRNPQADQDTTVTGRTSTRNAVTGDSSIIGSKGRKTQTTLRDSRAGTNNASKAKSWLAKEELLVEGESVSPTALSQALMWLAAGEKNTVEQLVDGIRAVTLCLGECDREQTVEVIRTSIKDTSASWVEEAKKEMKKAAEEIIGDAKKRMENSAGIGSRSWADETEGEFQCQTIQEIAKAIPTYAQVLAKEWRIDVDKKDKREHHNYMVREALRRRRILIDGIEGVQSAAGGLTPKELVEKAKIALAAARADTEGNGVEPEKDPIAVAARILENRGVVVEMESEEEADWVRMEDVRQAFEKNFGRSAKVKDQLYQVVASFLPVTFWDELENAASKIEMDNKLPPDCVAHCRWLKAPKFWNNGQ